MATFYSPKGRRNSYKTPYVPNWAHKVQLKVSTFNWIVVLDSRDTSYAGKLTSDGASDDAKKPDQNGGTVFHLHSFSLNRVLCHSLTQDSVHIMEMIKHFFVRIVKKILFYGTKDV